MKKTIKSKSKKITIKKSKKSSLVSNKLVLGFIFLGAICYFIYSRLPKAVPIGINEVSPAASGVTLSLPSSVKSTIGSEVSIDMTIATDSLAVTAAQVELSYDPTSISTPTLTQGDFLSEKLGNPKIQNGKINFVYSIPMQGTPKSGSGKLGTLTFKLLKDNATLAFTENTMVAASGLTSNALTSATGTTITSGSTSTSTTTVATPKPINNQVNTKPQNNAPVNTEVSDNPKTDSTQTRVFNETGNFDYSKRPLVDMDIEDSTTPQLTGFAGFLARLKAFFGRDNVQN